MTEFDLGVSLMERGDIKSALDQFSRFVAKHPESEEGCLFRAICLARLGKVLEARQSFDELLVTYPQCLEAQTWAAELAYACGDYAGAIHWAAQATAKDPCNSNLWCIRGRCLLRLKQGDEAVAALETAVSLEPSRAQFHHFLASAYEQTRRHDRSVEHLRNAIALAPGDPRYYLALSASYARFGLAGPALDVLTEALLRIPNQAALHTAAAAAFTQIRNHRAAEAHHLKAVELSADARIAYALWLVDQGRYDDALGIYANLIQEQPLNGAAYYGILQCRKLTQDDEHLLSEMEAKLQSSSLTPASRMFLSYALGKGREQRREYGEAMRHFDEANRLAYLALSSAAPFNLEAIQADGARVMKQFENLRERKVEGVRGPAPIFIIGMIRSGTTLLDQVVSSHPMVSNAGELRYWIEKGQWLADQVCEISAETLTDIANEYLEYVHHLVGESDRFTDKMPLYFAYTGLIHRAFPDARFLHIKRHPADTCLSIYTTYFGTGSHFVYNKANIVAYYREYERMMGYWRAILPSNRLLEINYEDLVTDREQVVRTVTDFCGLPWDDACLRHEENRSAINTPSRWQARQPVYRTSMERWRNYEPWLGEFGQLLRP